MNHATLNSSGWLSSPRGTAGDTSACSLSKIQDWCSYPLDSLQVRTLLSADTIGHEPARQPRACLAPSPAWSLPCLTMTATIPTGMRVPMTQAFAVPVSSVLKHGVPQAKLTLYVKHISAAGFEVYPSRPQGWHTSLVPVAHHSLRCSGPCLGTCGTTRCVFTNNSLDFRERGRSNRAVCATTSATHFFQTRSCSLLFCSRKLCGQRPGNELTRGPKEQHLHNSISDLQPRTSYYNKARGSLSALWQFC